MNSYLITGKDSGSDRGTYTLIIQAASQAEAFEKAKTHLNLIGREDLVEDLTEAIFSKLPKSDLVVYSAVERIPY